MIKLKLIQHIHENKLIDINQEGLKMRFLFIEIMKNYLFTIYFQK